MPDHDLLAVADRAWRDPEEVVARRAQTSAIDPRLLHSRVSGDWWGILEQLDACLVVSREYEHLLLGLTSKDGSARQSYMNIPHPSGLVFDAERSSLHVASTRNPNQIYTLAPVAVERDGHAGCGQAAMGPPLLALGSSFLPGRLYLHDLALVGGALHGNAVGLNAVVSFPTVGSHSIAWWPKAIENDGIPDFSRNYLQLNSIAAGPDLESSFFSASTAEPSRRLPGHRNFPVDRRGVIFSGLTREPVAHGLTRPHSARIHHDELWANDSGYGRVVTVGGGTVETFAQLPGWTRGLAFAGDIVFVGTSRVLTGFTHYAPGVDVTRSVCGIHALDVSTGEILGSIVWPAGNQIFDIVVLPRKVTCGFPSPIGRRRGHRSLTSIYSSYSVPDTQVCND